MAQVDYCTLAEVKEHFSITGSGSDTVINAALPRVTAIFNMALDRDLRKTLYTELQDGLGSPFLFLPHYPIITVTSVEDDGAAVDSDNYVVYNSRGEIKLTDAIETSRGFVGTFPRGDQNVEVVYTAGYTLEGTVTSPEIALPADVIMAAILMVGFVINNPKVTSYVSEKIGNYTYRKGSSVSEEARSYIPDEIWSILSFHKRRDFLMTRRGY